MKKFTNNELEYKFYNSDCLEAMKAMKDNQFDLAIVDPPYGIGENGGTNKTRSKLAKAKEYKPFAGEDIKPPSKEYFIELQRVSKNQIIWGANHFIQNIPNANSSCWIVWDKNNGAISFADCELAYTSFTSAVRKFKYTWHGMIQENMKSKEFRIHPTQKPVALYKWLLQNYAKKGDVILDTHIGSGSSAIACYDDGYSFTGFELDTDYFNSMINRFENNYRQLRLL